MCQNDRRRTEERHQMKPRFSEDQITYAVKQTQACITTMKRNIELGTRQQTLCPNGRVVQRSHLLVANYAGFTGSKTGAPDRLDAISEHDTLFPSFDVVSRQFQLNGATLNEPIFDSLDISSRNNWKTGIFSDLRRPIVDGNYHSSNSML